MKTQNPLIGRSRKSYGDATFYTLNGQNIVRTKPMVVGNPNTPAQQMQRERFGAFTRAANSLSEADLNMLFKTTEIGRNRRSMLQAQLAPAFGVQPSSNPMAGDKYETTFDATKLDKIGSGAVGYVGDFQQATFSENNLILDSSRAELIKNNMVLDGSETHVFIVCVAEDGCVIKVANPITMTAFNAAISGGTDLTIEGISGLLEHGENVWCYAVGAEVQTLTGGSFIIIRRPQKTGRNQKHNTPV